MWIIEDITLLFNLNIKFKIYKRQNILISIEIRLMMRPN